MWNEKELLDEIDDYFNRITDAEFLADIESVGCLDFIEEIMLTKNDFTYLNNKGNTLIKVKAPTEVKIGTQFINLLSTFNTQNKSIKYSSKLNYSYSDKTYNISIGA